MTFIGIDGRNNSLVPIRYSKLNQKLGEVFYLPTCGMCRIIACC
jgi:hypothetical protein